MTETRHGDGDGGGRSLKTAAEALARCGSWAPRGRSHRRGPRARTRQEHGHGALPTQHPLSGGIRRPRSADRQVPPAADPALGRVMGRGGRLTTRTLADHGDDEHESDDDGDDRRRRWPATVRQPVTPRAPTPRPPAEHDITQEACAVRTNAFPPAFSALRLVVILRIRRSSHPGRVRWMARDPDRGARAHRPARPPRVPAGSGRAGLPGRS